MTITEALADIKTTAARIAKKREFVQAYLFRQDKLRDPLASDGGSAPAVQRELQAIADLERRIIALRTAIAAANTVTTITVGETARSITEWLTWRREVAPMRQEFVKQLQAALADVRRQALQKGLVVVGVNQPTSTPDDVIVNLNEQEVAQEAEKLAEVLGTLDGQLSLKNATVTVNVP